VNYRILLLKGLRMSNIKETFSLFFFFVKLYKRLFQQAELFLETKGEFQN